MNKLLTIGEAADGRFHRNYFWAFAREQRQWFKVCEKIVTNSKMKLFFQTGNAKIRLRNKPEFKVDRAKSPVVGCLAKIEF